MTKDHAKSRRMKQLWAERRAATTDTAERRPAIRANRSNLRKAQARRRRRKTQIPFVRQDNQLYISIGLVNNLLKEKNTS